MSYPDETNNGNGQDNPAGDTDLGDLLRSKDFEKIDAFLKQLQEETGQADESFEGAPQEQGLQGPAQEQAQAQKSEPEDNHIKVHIGHDDESAEPTAQADAAFKEVLQDRGLSEDEIEFLVNDLLEQSRDDEDPDLQENEDLEQEVRLKEVLQERGLDEDEFEFIIKDLSNKAEDSLSQQEKAEEQAMAAADSEALLKEVLQDRALDEDEIDFMVRELGDTDQVQGDLQAGAKSEPSRGYGSRQEIPAQEQEEPELPEDDQDEEYAEPDESFASLGLSAPVLKAVEALGFESPTPIQLQAIPVVLSGRDMIGQAQTGTGKTAAFALPILSKIDCSDKSIQALILEPTRELALQSAESFMTFAKFLPQFRVAPIYGGASYENQIRSLRHGAQAVVATPGRLIDLIERGKIDLSSVKYLVIDEADEMLRMGFIEDVDWILDHTPRDRENALFSATMPEAVRRIASSHLKNPVEVRIETHAATASTVRQRYWVVSGVHKIDAMTRMLEVEPYDAVLVFVRTKTDAEDVANKLMGRGFSCAALHGDIPQRQREKIIERLKSGALDIIIATDVAARGLDVDRITHVFNYDIPYDAESYVHRIGRTGRAGRTGEAILFVSPRERRALRMIERVTRQRIEPMRMPTVADVNKRRLENFRNEILEIIEEGSLGMYLEVVSDILSDDSLEPEILAAALAKMARGGKDLLLDESEPEPLMKSFDEQEHSRRSRQPSAEAVPLKDFPDLKMVRYRLAVGRRDGVKPGHIVGAIANEADMDSRYIGEISIFDSFSTVDLPDGMPPQTRQILAKARVCGRPLDLREYTAIPPKKHPRGDDEHEGERRSFEERPDRSFKGRKRGRLNFEVKGRAARKAVPQKAPRRSRG